MAKVKDQSLYHPLLGKMTKPAPWGDKVMALENNGGWEWYDGQDLEDQADNSSTLTTKTDGANEDAGIGDSKRKGKGGKEPTA